MNNIRKIDVTPVEGKSNATSKSMLKKLALYRRHKDILEGKSLKGINGRTGLSVRSIIRIRLVEKYGSNLTKDNVYSGKVTLSFAETKIKQVIDAEKEKELTIEENGYNKANIVNDTQNGGREVTLEYFKARNEFFNQVLLSKTQNFKLVPHDLIENDVVNMLELITEG